MIFVRMAFTMDDDEAAAATTAGAATAEAGVSDMQFMALALATGHIR